MPERRTLPEDWIRVLLESVEAYEVMWQAAPAIFVAASLRGQHSWREVLHDLIVLEEDGLLRERGCYPRPGIYSTKDGQTLRVDRDDGACDAECQIEGEKPGDTIITVRVPSQFPVAGYQLTREGHELLESPARAQSPDGGTEEFPPVDDEDVAILLALRKASPRILTNLEVAKSRVILESGTRVIMPSEKTVAARMTRLLTLGLAERPAGKRRGATITDRGRQLLARIPVE